MSYVHKDLDQCLVLNNDSMSINYYYCRNHCFSSGVNPFSIGKILKSHPDDKSRRETWGQFFPRSSFLMSINSSSWAWLTVAPWDFSSQGLNNVLNSPIHSFTSIGEIKDNKTPYLGWEEATRYVGRYLSHLGRASPGFCCTTHSHGSLFVPWPVILAALGSTYQEDFLWPLLVSTKTDRRIEEGSIIRDCSVLVVHFCLSHVYAPSVAFRVQ